MTGNSLNSVTQGEIKGLKEREKKSEISYSD